MNEMPRRMRWSLPSEIKTGAGLSPTRMAVGLPRRIGGPVARLTRMASPSLNGSCGWGAIRFEISEPLVGAAYSRCHEVLPWR